MISYRFLKGVYKSSLYCAFLFQTFNHTNSPPLSIFYGGQRLKADILPALYKSTTEFAFYWSLSSCKMSMLSFRVIAGNEGATPYFLLLFESEKRVCCNEILFWELRIKEITALFKRKRDRVSITRSQSTEREISLFFLLSPKEEYPFFWLSPIKPARKEVTLISDYHPFLPQDGRRIKP